VKDALVKNLTKNAFSRYIEAVSTGVILAPISRVEGMTGLRMVMKCDDVASGSGILVSLFRVSDHILRYSYDSDKKQLLVSVQAKDKKPLLDWIASVPQRDAIEELCII